MKSELGISLKGATEFVKKHSKGLRVTGVAVLAVAGLSTIGIGVHNDKTATVKLEDIQNKMNEMSPEERETLKLAKITEIVGATMTGLAGAILLSSSGSESNRKKRRKKLVKKESS